MAIASKKVYDFESLPSVGWNINELTDQKRWTPMMQIKEELYLVLIREFYGKVEVNKEITTLTSTLRLCLDDKRK